MPGSDQGQIKLANFCTNLVLLCTRGTIFLHQNEFVLNCALCLRTRLLGRAIMVLPARAKQGIAANEPSSLIS